MNSIHFSTLAMPVRDQFGAWCEWFDPLFDCAPLAGGAGAGFAAEARVWSFGQAALSRVRAPRLCSMRAERNLRRDALDHWNIVVGGVETRLSRAGHVVAIPAETPFVVSLGETLESERDADTRVQLFLPRDDFAALAPILDRARGLPLVVPSGRLLAGYLHLLDRTIPDLPAECLRRLAGPIQAMVAACVAPSAADMEQAAEQIDLTRLEQVRQAIRRRMHCATLGTHSLCRDVGMSRSQLYRLLEGEGGVVRYIQRLRLLACHAALSDASDKRPVRAIGESVGFYDHSTLSRAFRREFQIAPSDLRSAAQAGVAPAYIGGPATGAEARSLISYLRRI